MKLISAKPAPNLLTTHEVAKLFGVHPQTVRRWARDGRLREIRPGPLTVRFSAEDIRSLIGGEPN